MPHLKLREANINDCHLIFKWRNDPWIMEKGSLNSKVSIQEHTNWFNNFVENTQCQMYIIEIDNQEAGQVRFTGEENSPYTEISIYLLKEHIGKGNGIIAIEQACKMIKEKNNAKGVIAYILTNNQNSLTTFKKVGFSLLETETTNIVKHKENHLTCYLEL